MRQISTNISSKYCQKTRYNYVRSSVFWDSTFTGKERDSETGFSYFGARYYDSDLMTGWLSVDPMADKYPSLSPYAYCAWNPVKLVDPDGEEIWIVGDDGTKIKYKANMTSSHIKDKVLSQQIQILNDMYSVEIGSEVLNTLISSSTKYTISNKSGINKGNCATRKEGNEVFIKMGGHNNLLSMSHELFHAFQYENNQGGATIYNEVEAFLYSAGVATTFEFSKGKGGGIQSAILSKNNNTLKGRLYEKAMGNLLYGNFSIEVFNIAMYLFKSESSINTSGDYNSKQYSLKKGNEKSLLSNFYPLVR